MDWMNRPNPYTGAGSGALDVPDLVQLSDVPAPDASSVMLGLGSRGPVPVDLDSESPHILVNAPTGRGKSAIARSIAVQRLALGDLVIVLDVKMHSQRWARELAPIVHYADTAADVGHALVNLGQELQRRNRVVRDFTGPVSEAPVGPRIIVVFEETNATLGRLKELDKQVPSGGPRALDAFGDIMFMGRAVKVHMVAFAQLASFRSGLTPDLIENFGTKVLIGHSERAWKWLVPECGRYRAASLNDGRGMVCRGSMAVETQLTWVDELSATEHVLSAVPAQRRVREMTGRARRLPPVWRTAISSR